MWIILSSWGVFDSGNKRMIHTTTCKLKVDFSFQHAKIMNTNINKMLAIVCYGIILNCAESGKLMHILLYV